MTTPNITDLIAKLQGHAAWLSNGLAGKPLDEQAAYWRTCDTIQRTISGLKNTPEDLNQLLAKLAEREEHRAAVLKKQALLEEEIAAAAAQEWRTFADAHERDREFDRQRTLRMQLQMLHEGTLLIAPGIAAGRLSEIDARIAELQQKIAILRARLASMWRPQRRCLANALRCRRRGFHGQVGSLPPRSGNGPGSRPSVPSPPAYNRGCSFPRVGNTSSGSGRTASVSPRRAFSSTARTSARQK